LTRMRSFCVEKPERRTVCTRCDAVFHRLKGSLD
jgi:hypothetical protein